MNLVCKAAAGCFYSKLWGNFKADYSSPYPALLKRREEPQLIGDNNFSAVSLKTLNFLMITSVKTLPYNSTFLK